MYDINDTRRAAFSLVAASLLTTVSAFAAIAQDYTAENSLKVALVLPGNLGDKSFCDSAAAGLSKAAAELPILLKIIEAGDEQTAWHPALLVRRGI